jgi:hypothetical protein
MKIKKTTKVTITLDEVEQQHLARVLHGYHRYRETSPKATPSAEVEFLEQLEGAIYDPLGLLTKKVSSGKRKSL